MKIQPYSRHSDADDAASLLAKQATQALLDEARLSPNLAWLIAAVLAHIRI